MDAIDAFIATIHQWMGHDKAAAFLGQPPGDKSQCTLCHPELRRPAQ